MVNFTMQKIKDETHAFQMAFLIVIERFRAKKYMEDGQMNHTTFAKLAFPGVSDPVRKWQRIRNEGVAMGVGESFMAARALGESYSYIAHLAEHELTSLDKEMSPQEKVTTLSDQVKEMMQKKAG